MAGTYLASKSFWVATAERAISTACQAILGIGIWDAITIATINFQQVFTVGLLAAVAAVLKCIVAGGVTKESGPSFTKAEVLAPEGVVPDDREGKHSYPGN